MVDVAQYTAYDYDEYHVCITAGSDSVFTILKMVPDRLLEDAFYKPLESRTRQW